MFSIFKNKHFSKVRRTKDSFIDPTVVIWGEHNLVLEGSAALYEFVIIRARTSEIRIGTNSHIGPFCVLFDGAGIEIGRNVMVAPHCVFAAGSHNYRQAERPIIHAGDCSKGKIIVGNDVWIGANCSVLEGVTIGDGAVIGANAVVNRNVGPFDIVGGVPAKKIGSRLSYQTRDTEE